MTRPEEAFRKEIQQYQDPPERIVADGQIHRYGPKQALWYVLHLDGVPAGAFGDWRNQDEQRKWCAKGTSEMTVAERRAHRERMERTRREHDDKRQRQHEKTKAEAESTWTSAQPADPGHGYLIRKGIQPHNLRQTQRDGLEVLLVAARDVDDNLWNLQRIYPDQRERDKLFLKGGRKQGCFHTFGEPSEIRVLCEGIATAASLHEATGYCVHSTFDCGNLLPVAEALRAKHPQDQIIIAGDDDHRTEGNPGVRKAEEAARAVNGTVALPDFGTDRPDHATDFNDLHQLKGLEVVKQCIENAKHPQQVSDADPELADRQRAGLQESTGKEFRLCLLKESGVRMKHVRWLWPGILPLGKLVILAGDPGLGKSQVSLYVAAIVSKGGTWPVLGEGCESGKVIILSAEDGAEDTIVPRLKAAGADLERVHIVQAVRQRDGLERHLDLTSDAQLLRGEVERLGNVRLIIVDPISSYLGKVDSHRNTEVRAALNPLVELAEDVSACLLCVTHLNKSSANALSRVTGSIAFVASARASYVVTKDEQDPERRLMLPLKNNLAKDTSGFAYTVEETGIDGGITTSKVIWEAELVTVSADEALAPTSDRQTIRKAAEDFLHEELKDGNEVACNDLYERAKAQGISQKVLWSIKEKLGVAASKSSFSGGWAWRLPIGLTPEDSQGSQDSQNPKIPMSNIGIFDKRESSQDSFTGVI